MRVSPEISAVSPSTVNLGNGLLATQFITQTLDTTVIAEDGETVAIGGMIQKRDEKHENKVPWLGDLPYIGAAFRYRTQTKTKTELLIVMTPHIVRNKADAARIMAMEAARMDWVIPDVLREPATQGLPPLLPPPPPPPGADGRHGRKACMPENSIAPELYETPAPVTVPGPPVGPAAAPLPAGTAPAAPPVPAPPQPMLPAKPDAGPPSAAAPPPAGTPANRSGLIQAAATMPAASAPPQATRPGPIVAPMDPYATIDGTAPTSNGAAAPTNPQDKESGRWRTRRQ